MTQRSTQVRSHVLLSSARQALRMWTAPQWLVALATSTGFALLRRVRGQVSCPVAPAAGPHPAPRQTGSRR